MASIAKLKEYILPITQDEGVILYDVEWVQDGKMKILQVSIMNEDGKIDIDTCSVVSERISNMLDDEDLVASEYYLEVCSPGAERVLRNDEEIKDALHKYIYIKFRNPNAGMHEVQGYLDDIQDASYIVEYMAKNIKKKVEVAKDNVDYIRLAVKF